MVVHFAQQGIHGGTLLHNKVQMVAHFAQQPNCIDADCDLSSAEGMPESLLHHA